MTTNPQVARSSRAGRANDFKELGVTCLTSFFVLCEKPFRNHLKPLQGPPGSLLTIGNLSAILQ